MRLTDRQKLILTLIIHEHIQTAQPVGSKTLVQKYHLSMSSATVRNEMVTLTDYNLLRQPYTSAGRVPSEEGYRYFVGNLIHNSTLPTTTRRTITHQFYQSRQDVEQWLKLAASVLANQSQAAALVTAPHAEKAIFKHLELIATRGRQVLMVLVLMGGEIRQQFISLAEPVPQDHLSEIATKLSNMCARCDAEGISRLRGHFDALGQDIIDILMAEMTLRFIKLIVSQNFNTRFGKLRFKYLTIIILSLTDQFARFLPDFSQLLRRRHIFKVKLFLTVIQRHGQAANAHHEKLVQN
jgi:heat-inducible transcriptional repressor